MRLFIAFEIPENLTNLFKQLQKEFSGLGRITFTKEFHCTLKFLGDVPEDKLEEIKSKLNNVKFEQFEVSLDGLGAFPNENHARVLWLGLNGKVRELQETIEGSLSGIFEKDKRFHPHITLGRVKILENKNKFKEELKTNISPEKFMIKEFKLIQSTLTPQGAKYTAVQIYHSL